MESTGRHPKAESDLQSDSPQPRSGFSQRQRVVVADPRRLTANSFRPRIELEQQTSWGERLISGLMRRQQRAGISLVLLVVAFSVLLPLAFYLSPTFGSVTVIGVPVAWILLGIVPFCLCVLVGLWHNRIAEGHERAFVDMIDN